MQKLMQRLSKKYDPELFERLAEELTAHSRAEEAVLYKPVVDDDRARDKILEGYEEHHVADLVLRELSANSKGTDRWMAKFGVLKENVEHHIEEEESEMFETLRSIVPQERAKAMTGEFESQKARV